MKEGSRKLSSIILYLNFKVVELSLRFDLYSCLNECRIIYGLEWTQIEKIKRENLGIYSIFVGALSMFCYIGDTILGTLAGYLSPTRASQINRRPSCSV